MTRAQFDSRDSCPVLLPQRSRIARSGVMVLITLSLFVTPVAAQSGGSAGIDICSTSTFPAVANAIIQLAIYGGVILGATLYLGAEALESRAFMSEQQVQSLKSAKRAGLGKILKLSLVPALLALLLKSSPLAWADCIELVPF